MARVKPGRAPGDPWVIAAEDEAERALLAFCLARQAGTLVLDGANYPVQKEALIVPDSSSEANLHRVREAFQRAAAAHQRAMARRRKFDVVDTSK